MAYSKIILNGDTLMDVTSDTVDAGDLLYGETATKNDGTKVTGSIVSKDSTNLSVDGATVTAAAGYYSSAVSKTVSTTTHPNPSASITSSTGVVTATHTQSAGYVTSGTTNGTLNLTTKAAATIYPSTADQTISSYRWLTGTQTIKSVTTSNLLASNIASGVVVKVGDANNASRISQVTGTYAPAVSALTVTPTETQQTFNATGVYGYKPVTVNGISSTYVGTGVSQRSSANTTFANATGTFTAPAGYYSADATNTITTQAAQTITPGTTSQYINSYRWLTGSQTIKGDANLVASNIADGVSIFGVSGTHQGGGGGGGFTADNIAMRTVSGDISGSATSIGDYAFHSCILLTTASFPSATTIGDYAFRSCYSLTTASFPSATSIGSYAFAYCYSLTTISFPTATTISNYAFAYCYSLTTASFQSTTTIGNYAFTYCSSLTTASFPNATTIGGYAFRSCILLTTISFPIATTIGNYAFANCSALTTASFQSVTSIGNYAFAYCIALTTASFQSATSIGNYAFAYCYSLTTISFQSVTSIGANAFAYCIALTTISFPNATTIGSNAFSNCSALTTISFPNATTIGSNAFTYCRSLTTASFPKVTSISANAFSCCFNLLSFYLLGSSIPTLETNAFSSTPIGNHTTSTGGVYGSIFVPSSLYATYIAATNWSNYAARIVSV